jgi:hypothetical protein
MTLNRVKPYERSQIAWPQVVLARVGGRLDAEVA